MSQNSKGFELKLGLWDNLEEWDEVEDEGLKGC